MRERFLQTKNKKNRSPMFSPSQIRKFHPSTPLPLGGALLKSTLVTHYMKSEEDIMSFTQVEHLPHSTNI